MRTESAHSVNTTRKRCGPRLQRQPRPGTRLALLWELLHLYKGEPVDIYVVVPHGGSASAALNQLRDFYGLDIRKTNVCINHQSYKYALVGEWFGNEYRDYLAKELKL